MKSLPPNWQLVKIADVTMRAKPRDPSKTPDVPFRYVDVSSVSNKLFKIISSTRLLGSEAPSRARKEIKTNDVVFATVRPTLKRIALVSPDLNNEIASTGFCVLRPNPQKIAPEFLYHCLLTDDFIKHMGSLERGASYPAVRDSDVLSSIIPLPPIDEQRHISYMLTTVQNSIRQQDHIVMRMRELKSVLMRKFFSEGLYSEKQKETEIGLVPSNWEIVRLGDFADFKNGINFAAGEKGQGILTIDVLNMYGEGCSVSLENLYRVNKHIDESYLLQDEDLLFVRSSLKREGVGWTSLFKSVTDEPVTFCGFIIRARLKEKESFSSAFLTNYLRTDVARNRLVSGSGQVAITNINQGLLRELPVPRPPIKEQEEIASAIDIVDRRISLLLEKKNKLEELFFTLLHRLMAGQIAVTNIDLSKLS